jgi:SAM-dependent methyltransferase
MKELSLEIVEPIIFYTKEHYDQLKMDYSRISEQLTGVMKLFRSVSSVSDFPKDGYPDVENKYTNFPFIPMYVDSVIDQLKFVSNHFSRKPTKHEYSNTGLIQEDIRFLDAGCGIGWICDLFKKIHQNARVYGLELDENLLKLARILNYDQQSQRFLNVNILDFKNYSDYDVIYYYSPILTTPIEQQFERKVEDDCKVGCVIIANRKMDDLIKKDSRFKKLHDLYNIYVKVSNKKDKKNVENTNRN